jgi:hypothetical protein
MRLDTLQYLTYPVVWALYGWQEKWGRRNLAPTSSKAKGDLAGSAHGRFPVINHDPTNLESLTIHHIMGLMNLPHFDCPS